jgi:hypothetical protein
LQRSPGADDRIGCGKAYDNAAHPPSSFSGGWHFRRGRSRSDRRAPSAGAPDAEILTLSADIYRLAAEADEIDETRIKHLDEEFHNIIRSGPYGRVAKESLDKGNAFSIESGREAALSDQAELDKRADRAFDRMMAIPAVMQLSRAAKVRAFLSHTARDWRGYSGDLSDWCTMKARELLGEFAGMSEAELPAI